MNEQDSPAARAQARVNAARQRTYTETEATTVRDLEVGDWIVKLGDQTLPFPFEITEIRTYRGRSATLFADHGWFTMRPVPLAQVAERVTL